MADEVVQLRPACDVGEALIRNIFHSRMKAVKTDKRNAGHGDKRYDYRNEPAGDLLGYTLLFTV
jgi:hypothetical protein